MDWIPAWRLGAKKGGPPPEKLDASSTQVPGKENGPKFSNELKKKKKIKWTTP